MPRTPVQAIGFLVGFGLAIALVRSHRRRALLVAGVPLAAAIYHDDMYVDHVFSRETADAIGNSHVWITNEHEHCGLRVGGPEVIGRLLDLVRGLA